MASSSSVNQGITEEEEYSSSSAASTSINSSNIGFQLLKKHGWTEGTGLGVAQQESNTLCTEYSVVGRVNDEIIPVKDIVVDHTDVFTTHQLFSSGERLFDWVRDRGNMCGMVIVIRKLDTGLGKRRPQLFLACERSGEYCEFNNVGTPSQGNHLENVEKVDASKVNKKVCNRKAGIKECGCPFRLRGRQESVDGEWAWALYVECGVHNHPSVHYLEGHSYSGRLSKVEEDDYVMDMSKGNTRRNDILFGLEEKFIDNRSRLRTVYNGHTKNEVLELDGQSQMQQLKWKLKKHGYFYRDRCCEMTYAVKDMFFAHPTSVELLRAFPKVLFIGTYKTNEHKLPLLEITSVTSTHTKFFIAAAYLEFEHEDNYMWACTVLKSLMDRSSLPNVIVTDREINLMNALERTFLTSKHFLCRLHIFRNIRTNCKKKLRTNEKWDLFNLHWNLLVNADTETSFYNLVRRLQSEYTEFSAVVQYVMEQWVEPYKERFVSCWTNNVMHFENTTTNRKGSYYVMLKRQLGLSQGNFETCWGQFHSNIELLHNEIKGSFAKNWKFTYHKHNTNVFRFLRTRVSFHALNKIYEEMNSVIEGGVDPLLCGCVLRKTCGLPCAHEISEYVRLDKPIPLNQVDAFWRKLSYMPLSQNVNVEKIDGGCEPNKNLTN